MKRKARKTNRGSDVDVDAFMLRHAHAAMKAVTEGFDRGAGLFPLGAICVDGPSGLEITVVRFDDGVLGGRLSAVGPALFEAVRLAAEHDGAVGALATLGSRDASGELALMIVETRTLGHQLWTARVCSGTQRPTLDAWVKATMNRGIPSMLPAPVRARDMSAN